MVGGHGKSSTGPKSHAHEGSTSSSSSSFDENATLQDFINKKLSHNDDVQDDAPKSDGSNTAAPEQPLTCRDVCNLEIPRRDTFDIPLLETHVIF